MSDRQISHHSHHLSRSGGGSTYGGQVGDPRGYAPRSSEHPDITFARSQEECYQKHSSRIEMENRRLTGEVEKLERENAKLMRKMESLRSQLTNARLKSQQQEETIREMESALRPVTRGRDSHLRSSHPREGSRRGEPSDDGLGSLVEGFVDLGREPPPHSMKGRTRDTQRQGSIYRSTRGPPSDLRSFPHDGHGYPPSIR